MSIYDVLKEKGIVLPPAPPKGGVYSPAKEFGDKLVYIWRDLYYRSCFKYCRDTAL